MALRGPDKHGYYASEEGQEESRSRVIKGLRTLDKSLYLVVHKSMRYGVRSMDYEWRTS